MTDACSDLRPLLSAYIDDELDAAHAMRVADHLIACAQCRNAHAKLMRLHRTLRQEGLRYPASDVLHRKIAALVVESPTGRVRATRILQRWSWVPSLAMLAFSVLLVFSPLSPPSLEGDLVAGHVRSLQVDHLTDVATSDQHTVKPWFNGKLDFAPPVIDLIAQGFPLVGGRLDYVEGHTVAAVVYRSKGHVINLFIGPDLDTAHAAITLEGYNLRQWREADLTFWAVSDVNMADLTSFQTEFIAATSK